jgi:phosphosulfolactate phosphohydrolase-like enzyme
LTVFLHFQASLAAVLRACSSGKEAAERGSLYDVQLAANMNVCQAAPRLVDGAYQA